LRFEVDVLPAAAASQPDTNSCLGHNWFQQREESAMSVLMTLRVNGDARALEKLAVDDPTIFGDILEKAKPRGLVSHHFYGNDTEILVVDEWRDEESFQAFFQDAGKQIQELMGHAGVSTEPAIKFWHKLETGDDVG
jgi:hypothetical protein